MNPGAVAILSSEELRRTFRKAQAELRKIAEEDQGSCCASPPPATPDSRAVKRERQSTTSGSTAKVKIHHSHHEATLGETAQKSSARRARHACRCHLTAR